MIDIGPFHSKDYANRKKLELYNVPMFFVTFQASTRAIHHIGIKNSKFGVQEYLFLYRSPHRSD